MMTLITGPDFNLIEAMYLDDESDEAFRNALRAAYEQGRRDAAPPPAAEPKWTEGAVCACGHKHVASALPGAPYVLCEAGTTDPRACACREWRPRGCDYAGCSGHANGDDGLCGECRARMSPGGRDYDGPSQPEATACPQSVCDGGGWLTTVSGRRIPCGACVKAGRVPDLDKKVKLPQSHDWEEKGLTLSLRCKRCHLDLLKLASKKYPSVCDAVSSCSHPTEDIYQTMESSAIMCRRCGQVVSGA